MNTNTMYRLQKACESKGPLCIGLDTDPSYVPDSVRKNYSSDSEAVLAYNSAIIEAASDFAACYKVQIAYYEAMGLAGLDAFSKTLRMVRGKNIPVISDIKRGDIADTAKAYARAHFSGDFETDIITVNPYMGFDTLEPFIEAAVAAGEKTGETKGMFVLLRTSNPGMTDIEKQALAENKGECVLDRVGSQLLKIADRFADHGISPVGAVVGCTEESDARALRDKYKNLFFLIPGYGAQGGAARIAATLLDNAGGTVNSSRGILCAWKKDPGLAEKRDSGILTLDDIAQAAARAAEASKQDLLGAKNLIK